LAGASIDPEVPWSEVAVGQGSGLLVYARNLYLIYRERAALRRAEADGRAASVVIPDDAVKKT